LLKTIIVEALKQKKYFVFYQKYICQDKYPAGYPVSGHNRISGIRQKQYPVHPYYIPYLKMADPILMKAHWSSAKGGKSPAT
jgi:hypothetical protein